MLDLGVSQRQIAQELEISKTSVHNLSRADDLDPVEVEAVKVRLESRMVVASDRFLSQALDRIKELSPYQAMLCAGIAHDHYLRASLAGKAQQVGSLTQILILVDQRARGQGDATQAEASSRILQVPPV